MKVRGQESGYLTKINAIGWSYYDLKKNVIWKSLYRFLGNNSVREWSQLPLNVVENQGDWAVNVEDNLEIRKKTVHFSPFFGTFYPLKSADVV